MAPLIEQVVMDSNKVKVAYHFFILYCQKNASFFDEVIVFM